MSEVRHTVSYEHRLSPGLSQAVTGCHRDCHRLSQAVTGTVSGCHRRSQGLSQAVTGGHRDCLRLSQAVTGTVTGCHRRSQGLSQAVTGCHRDCHRLSQAVTGTVTPRTRKCIRLMLGLSVYQWRCIYPGEQMNLAPFLEKSSLDRTSGRFADYLFVPRHPKADVLLTMVLGPLRWRSCAYLGARASHLCSDVRL